MELVRTYRNGEVKYYDLGDNGKASQHGTRLNGVRCNTRLLKVETYTATIKTEQGNIKYVEKERKEWYYASLRGPYNTDLQSHKYRTTTKTI